VGRLLDDTAPFAGCEVGRGALLLFPLVVGIRRVIFDLLFDASFFVVFCLALRIS
jgi:hypothetical protein